MAAKALQDTGLEPELIRAIQSWGIQTLTEVQQQALDAGCADANSLVVCAPTSAGKTLVAEIAVWKALQSDIRCIYLVSHKALADQKYAEFEQRFGTGSHETIASVGLSTGDREEGEINPRLLVATYEKALALLLAGQIDPAAALVVADELQIIAEAGRGPNIESLCSILRQRKLHQLIALTATVGNPEDLASWLNCDLVLSLQRDVVLFQEIWSHGNIYSLVFGNDDGEESTPVDKLPTNPIDVVTQLLDMGRGPVLTFTESRNESIQLAEEFGQHRARTAEGISISQELSLFSEPTESSETLQQLAQRRTTFHTADLTPQERQVIELGFIEGRFDACFATSTLAAGVNFPFQTVFFPKLTYEFGDRGGTMISRPDYRNMSGRAGRLGMHSQGFAILLPKSSRELQWSNQLMLPENENVSSKLVSISMRRTILTLVASGVVGRESDIRLFFENTLYWYQISDTNPGRLDDIVSTAQESVAWLEDRSYLEVSGGAFTPTPLGKAVAQSGLLPSTASDFCEMLREHKDSIDSDFESFLPALIHWACTCDEFAGDTPSRFLVYPLGREPVQSTMFLAGQKLIAPLDRTDRRTNQCAHALVLYAQGTAERQIRYTTNISAGGVHRLAIDVAWIIDGLQRIAASPELQCPQTLTNKLAMLSRRVRSGVPAEILDVLRVAQRSGVPGLGRQRAMGLLSQGLITFDLILTTARDKLLGILRSERRVDELINAMSNVGAIPQNRFAALHLTVAKKLGLEEIVRECEANLGTEYERAVRRLLESETRWAITELDDGKEQNVPDILISLREVNVLVECKTTTKKPPLIKKEEAFSVLQKAVDFEESLHRVTLGKPAFDEHSKNKVLGADSVTLVEHSVFMEGVLRVLTGSVSPEDFLEWLSAPGLAEVERLSGIHTMEVARDSAS